MEQKNSFGVKKKINNIKSFNLTFWKIFDISLFGRGVNEVLKIIDGWINSEAKNKWIATVNPEFVMKALKDNAFKAILRETDLNVVDGIGLIWAREISKKNPITNFQFLNRLYWGFKVGVEILQGKHKEELVSGSDLMPELCKLASKKGYKVFLLGGWGDRAKKSADFLKSKFLISGDKISWSQGEPEIKNKEVLKQMAKFKPDILLLHNGRKNK